MEERKEAGNAGKKERRLSIWYILGGGILKEDFIVRNTRMPAFIRAAATGSPSTASTGSPL